MDIIHRFDDRTAASAAGLTSRPLAAIAGFFTWWGEHRAWPANEPARIEPACARRNGAGAI